ncbi:cytochrome c [Methylocapsa sp. S129]|uniref:c-type cytochrome n=1 Tax=Methylocapsa sp. S129 TaxID=1641869 RepID=UPI00131EB0A2|nr:cytochrome c [Methylocapsa sp. S129]
MRLTRPILARVGVFTLSLAFFVAGPSGAGAQGDVKAGREKAQKCEACHGLDGLSKIPEAPSLAGQNEQYINEQLNAFKSGERKNDMMSLIVPTLSPQDIEDLAAYYAAIEVTVGKIPGQ